MIHRRWNGDGYVLELGKWEFGAPLPSIPGWLVVLYGLVCMHTRLRFAGWGHVSVRGRRALRVYNSRLYRRAMGWPLRDLEEEAS